jgi:hypothetical protein
LLILQEALLLIFFISILPCAYEIIVQHLLKVASYNLILSFKL